MLTKLFALLVPLACSGEVPVNLNETLRVAAARHNLYLGSQFKGDTIQSDVQYKAVHAQQFSVSTVGNQCKWGATERDEGKFSLDSCNAAFAYARSAG